MLAYGSHLDMYRFEGDEEMNTTFTAVANVATRPSLDRAGIGVMDITAADHGYKRGDDVFGTPNHIFIKGAAVYEGLAVIIDDDSVDANSLFVSGQFSATDTGSLYPGLQFNEPWWFMGYSLTLDAACATAENFTIDKDAKAGASFDTNIVTVPMNGVSSYIEMFEQPWPIFPKDIVYCSFANTDDNTWGLELYALAMR